MNGDTLNPDAFAPAIMNVESGGNPRAISPKGAIGLYQIMPATAERYGYTRKDLFKPEVQNDIYNRHMGYLLNKYKDPSLAFAAWNAGEGNVDKGVFPAETRNYIPKVWAAYARGSGQPPGMMSRLESAFNPGTAFAAESPTGRTGEASPQMGRYKYSPSTGRFGIVAEDGSVRPVMPDQVPPDIRSRATARFHPPSPKPPTGVEGIPALPSGPPEAASAASPTGVPDAAALPTSVSAVPPGAPPEAPTLEQQYERGFAKLPTPLQYVAPGTIGEAAGTAGQVARPALLAAAPFTGPFAPVVAGAGALAPYALAGVGGYLEPSDQPWISRPRAERAAVEVGKQLAGSALGHVAGAIPEYSARYLGRGSMLGQTAERVGQGLKNLFHDYPLPVPKTADEFTEQVASGPLADATGKALGDFRKKLAQIIPNEKFTLMDVNTTKGELEPVELNTEKAIEHIRKVNAASYTPSGVEKGALLSWLYRQAGHQSREILRGDLNRLGAKVGEKWGDELAQKSADHGTAAVLEDVFKNATRTSRIAGKPTNVIDQPTLFRNLKKVMPDLTTLQGKQKASAFQRAVAPTLTEAIPESGAREPRGGLFHTLIRAIGSPYMPETRAMLPPIARQLSSARAKRIYSVPATRFAGRMWGDVPEEELPAAAPPVPPEPPR